MKRWDFNKLLKARGQSVGGLARAILSSHSHVSQVLSNAAGRGGQTRRKLAKHLTAAETFVLGWSEPGELPVADPEYLALCDQITPQYAIKNDSDVPQGTNVHVERK